MIRRATRATAPALAALVLSLSGCGSPGHSTGWKAADLDRNRYDLVLSRSGDHITGAALATATQRGRVVSASGDSRPNVGGDLEVIVRYDYDGNEFDPSVSECFRFSTDDGNRVEFHRVRCPD